jgi:hypothetical protein
MVSVCILGERRHGYVIRTYASINHSEADSSLFVTEKRKFLPGRDRMSDYDDDFMADDEDYDLEYSEDSNSGKWLSN